MGDPLTPEEQAERTHERKYSTPGTWPEASKAADTRAQVLVEVSGGIAESTYTGDVDIIHIDWDNVEDGDSEYIEEILEEARRILDTPIRKRVVKQLEDELEKRRADELWSEEQAKKRNREERERAASLLGVHEGSPEWIHLVVEREQEDEDR